MTLASHIENHFSDDEDHCTMCCLDSDVAQQHRRHWGTFMPRVGYNWMPVADTGLYYGGHWATFLEKSRIQSLKFTKTFFSTSSSQSNELGQIYVKWDIKTQILCYVSARSVARNSNCPNSTLCTVVPDSPLHIFVIAHYLSQIGVASIHWRVKTTRKKRKRWRKCILCC